MFVRLPDSWSLLLWILWNFGCRFITTPPHILGRKFVIFFRIFGLSLWEKFLEQCNNCPEKKRRMTEFLTTRITFLFNKNNWIQWSGLRQKANQSPYIKKKVICFFLLKIYQSPYYNHFVPFFVNIYDKL